MKKALLGIALLGLSLAAIACAPIEPTMRTGARAEITHDGLHRVDNAGFAAVWIKPGAELARYNKIFSVKPSFHYRKVRGSGGSIDGEFEVPERKRERFEQIVTKAFESSLAKSRYYSLSTQAGPNVLLLLSAVHDVVSHVPPSQAGRGITYVSEIGEATIVLELRDSETNEVLARAAERRAVAPADGLATSSSGSHVYEIRQQAARWGTKLRDQLDSLHER